MDSDANVARGIRLLLSKLPRNRAEKSSAGERESPEIFHLIVREIFHFEGQLQALPKRQRGHTQVMQGAAIDLKSIGTIEKIVRDVIELVDELAERREELDSLM